MAFDDAQRQRADDGALLIAYANGDPQAARALAGRVMPGVLALARRMLHDPAEAEDVAQETMVRLWKIAPEWDSSRAQVTTWAYRVAANMCTDRLRKRARLVAEDAAPERADETPGAEARLMGADRSTALRQAIDALPERQRIAIQLRHMEELGNGEIADVLQISVEAVESLLARARRALAAALRPRQSEIGMQ